MLLFLLLLLLLASGSSVVVGIGDAGDGHRRRRRNILRAAEGLWLPLEPRRDRGTFIGGARHRTRR